MASKDSTIEALLWLTPTAKDCLRTISKTLRGAVPCPAATLATSLGGADINEGVLGSADIQKGFEAELKALKSEVSDQNAAVLVDALGKVLKKEIDAIKTKAAAVKGKLPKTKKGEPMAGYKALESCGNKDALGQDWLVWHAAANAFKTPLSVSNPPEGVFAERAALAACCPVGPLGDAVIAVHVLENLDEYIKWEISLPGSQAPKAGIEVKCPFDSKMANEIAIRRVLTSVLPPDVAVAVLKEASSDASKLTKALQKVTADMKKQAVIPMYTAPPAPKEPKGAKDAKEPKDKKGKKGEEAAAPAAPAAGGKPAAAVKVVAGEPGSFAALHTATATQELQWHLLAYRLDPGTTLSKTMTGGAAKAGAPAAASGAAAAPKPQGFQGVFAVPGAPPGHTSVSWTTCGQTSAFQDTWMIPGVTPPGHTEFSYGNASSSVPATATPPAGKAPKPAKAASPKTSPKASPKAAPAAAPAAAGGPVDEAAIRAVGDEIRVLKDKLKADGLSGKKLNEHPEIVALVGKLAALKSGAAAPAPQKAAAKTSPKASPKGSPKAAPSSGGIDEAALKAVGDEIRVLKEKLKAEGVTGKKLNEHPDVVSLVGKLGALKKA